MEDEGRLSIISVHQTREDAEKAAADYCNDGYFSRSDLEIQETLK
jgi:hypothetical protein